MEQNQNCYPTKNLIVRRPFSKLDMLHYKTRGVYIMNTYSKTKVLNMKILTYEN